MYKSERRSPHLRREVLKRRDSEVLLELSPEK
jgi:hypothetical protein